MYGIDLGSVGDNEGCEETVIVANNSLLKLEQPDPEFEAKWLAAMEEDFEKRYDMRKSNKFVLDETRAGLEHQRDSYEYRRSIKVRHQDKYLEPLTKHLLKN